MVEEDGKHSLPAMKSGLADLVSLVVWTQPCFFVPAFAGDEAEWYPCLMSGDDIRHTLRSLRRASFSWTVCRVSMSLALE